MSTNNAAGSNIGVGGALLIAFVVLKLLHKIDWSWWWVLSPIWIPFVVVFSIVVPMLVVKAWTRPGRYPR